MEAECPREHGREPDRELRKIIVPLPLKYIYVGF